MTFLDIKDPAERVTLVKEYVKAMKPVKQRNMMKREMKLAIVHIFPLNEKVKSETFDISSTETNRMFISFTFQ